MFWLRLPHFAILGWAKTLSNASLILPSHTHSAKHSTSYCYNVTSVFFVAKIADVGLPGATQ